MYVDLLVHSQHLFPSFLSKMASMMRKNHNTQECNVRHNEEFGEANDSRVVKYTYKLQYKYCKALNSLLLLSVVVM